MQERMIEMNTDRLKQIMKEKNITKYKLALLTNISNSHISKIVNGNNPNPRINTVKVIAKALDVDIKEII